MSLGLSLNGLSLAAGASARSLGPIYLGQSMESLGSSSYANTGNFVTTDMQSVAITRPMGTTWQDTSAVLCPPLTTQTFVNYTGSPYSGNGNTSQYDIYRWVLDRISAGVFTETGKVCVFGGTNLLTAYPGTSSRVDNPGVPKEYYDTNLTQLVNWVIPTEAALSALGPATKYIYFWIYPVYGPDDNTREGQWTRYVKWKLSTEHHCLRPFANMREGLMRAVMAHAPNLDSVNAQACGFTSGTHKPWNDTSHANAESYYWIGVYQSKINKALYGGVPFVPTYTIYKAMTGPGIVANLRWFSSDDMANCTFSVDNPNFTVTREINSGGGTYNAYNLVLRLVGALPTVAPLWLNLTVTKFDQSETWRLPVVIDSQVSGDNTPYPVTMRQVHACYRGSSNKQDDRSGPFFTASSTQLTIACALKMEQFDSGQKMFRSNQGSSAAGTEPAVGAADTTSQILWVIERQTGQYKLYLRKTSVGQLQFQLWDDSATPVQIFNHATAANTLTVSKGWRFFMFTVDTANAAACKFHASAGKDIVSNIDYAAINETIVMSGGGNGNIALNHQTSTTTADMRIFQENPIMPSVSFTATIGHIWAAQGLVPNDSTSWDLFFDEAAQKARTYPVKTLLENSGDGKTWRGITPYMALKRKAAGWVAGCDSIAYTDAENGHKQLLNDGSGPSLLLAPMRPLVDQALTYF